MKEDYTGIPNLSFDGFVIYLDTSCSKLNADSRLGFQIELITRETGEQV